MTSRRWTLVLIAIAGCGKGSAGAERTGVEASVGASGADASAGATAGAEADAGALSDACGGVARWGGEYRSATGNLYMPPGWKSVTWHGVETTAGLGDGTLSIACDMRTGRLTGAVEGPLGPARVRGLIVHGSVTAAVERTDPSDHGFAGTLEATVEDGHVRGTMHVSTGEAGAIRVAPFDLSPAHMDPGKGAP